MAPDRRTSCIDAQALKVEEAPKAQGERSPSKRHERWELLGRDDRPEAPLDGLALDRDPRNSTPPFAASPGCRK